MHAFNVLAPKITPRKPFLLRHLRTPGLLSAKRHRHASLDASFPRHLVLRRCDHPRSSPIIGSTGLDGRSAQLGNGAFFWKAGPSLVFTLYRFTTSHRWMPMWDAILENSSSGDGKRTKRTRKPMQNVEIWLLWLHSLNMYCQIWFYGCKLSAKKSAQFSLYRFRFEGNALERIFCRYKVFSVDALASHSSHCPTLPRHSRGGGRMCRSVSRCASSTKAQGPRMARATPWGARCRCAAVLPTCDLTTWGNFTTKSTSFRRNKYESCRGI